jgi:hypothetical protein
MISANSATGTHAHPCRRSSAAARIAKAKPTRMLAGVNSQDHVRCMFRKTTQADELGGLRGSHDQRVRRSTSRVRADRR